MNPKIKYNMLSLIRKLQLTIINKNVLNLNCRAILNSKFDNIAHPLSLYYIMLI